MGNVINCPDLQLIQMGNQFNCVPYWFSNPAVIMCWIRDRNLQQIYSKHEMHELILYSLRASRNQVGILGAVRMYAETYYKVRADYFKWSEMDCSHLY